MASTQCPNCRLAFHNSSAVLKHMNHQFSSCHLWFTRDLPSPPLDTPRSPDTPTSASSHYFPGAGCVFGLGPGFLGWFQGDENADAWTSNLYYPFLSKGEWEIAAFLSRSGLSMKHIDEFLSLSSVSRPNYVECHVTDSLSDHRAGSFFSLRTNFTWKGRAPSEWARMEVYGSDDAWLHYEGPPRVVLSGPNQNYRISPKEPTLFWTYSVCPSPRF